MTTDRWRERGPRARIATQSGPMLVVDGEINRAFDARSDSLKWRSGVCAATPSRVVFAVSEAPVSFHAFARLFRDVLGCRDALYLDGTLSRLWTRGEGYAGAAAMMVKPYAGMRDSRRSGEIVRGSKAMLHFSRGDRCAVRLRGRARAGASAPCCRILHARRSPDGVHRERGVRLRRRVQGACWDRCCQPSVQCHLSDARRLGYIFKGQRFTNILER